jgi:hypothetical protein
MRVATVAFRQCVINPEIDGSLHEPEAPRVIFDLNIDGDHYTDLYVEVREGPKAGPNESPLEISELHGYEGPLNYEVLRGSIEFYFRQVVGGKESRINTQDKFLTLTDWTIEQEMVVQFEMPEEEGN